MVNAAAFSFPRTPVLFRMTGISRRVAVLLVALAALFAVAPGASAQAAVFSGAVKTVGGGFDYPSGVAVDGSGNIYIADTSNGAVKEMPAGCASASCVITLGGGFAQPFGVAVDGSGNIYVADSGNNAVKEMPAACASASCVTILGGGFIFPTGVAVDGSGNIYVAENNNAVKEMPAACFSASCVATLNGGFGGPFGVAVDGNGNIYIADTSNSAVKEMPAGCASASCVITLGGGFVQPVGVAVDGSGNIYVANYGNSAVMEMPAGCANASCVTTLGGSFNQPHGVAVDGSGNIYVADTGHDRVMEVTSASPFLSTAVGASSPTFTFWFTFTGGGNIGAPAVLTQGTAGLDFTDAGTGTCTTNGTGHVYNIGDTCTLDVIFSPQHPGTRLGAVELTNNVGAVIATGYVQGIGTGPQVTFGLGPIPNFSAASSATVGGGFSYPVYTAVDPSGDVFVADSDNHMVYKVPAGCASSVCVQILASGIATGPFGIAVDGAGNVFFTGYGLNGLEKIPYSAGTYGTPVTIASGFTVPWGLAVDGAGNLFVADRGFSSVVQKVSFQSGIYGSPITIGSGFLDPIDVAVDGSGNVFVADYGNHAVKKIPYSGSSYGIPVAISSVHYPTGVALDANGDLFVMNMAGTVTKLLGPSYTTSLSLGSSSGQYPTLGVSADGLGNIYIADGNTPAAILKWNFSDAPTLNFATTPTGNSSSDSPQTLVLGNDGNAALTFLIPGSGNNPSISSPFSLSNSSTCPQLTASSFSPGTLAAGSICTDLISFTPASAGSFSGSLVTTDNNLNAVSATQTVTLTGLGLIRIAPSSLSPTQIGVAYSQTFTASGGTAPYSYSISGGALPAGLTLSSTGALTGTPTAAGSFSFTIQVTDSAATPLTATQTYSLTVYPPTLVLPAPPLTPAKVGVFYSYSFSASGGTAPYTYTISAGSLPAGLTLSSTTGAVTGTPTQVSPTPSAAGPFNFTVKATDFSTGLGAPFSISQAYSLTVNAPTLVVPTSLPTGTIGAPYSQSLAASGGTAPYTYALTAGYLPLGMTFNTSTGLLSGTPITGGYYNFTIRSTDNSTGYQAPFSITQSYSLTVFGIPFAFVNPSSANFTSTSVGSTTSVTVSLQNSTASAMEITGIVISDPANFSESDDCGNMLAGNTSCNIHITFTPQSVGNLLGTLTINDSTLLSPQVVPLQGNATTSKPIVLVSPSSLNFSNQTQGTASAPLTVTIKNNSDFTLNITNITLSDLANFSLSNNTCGLTLAANGICSIQVSFTPQTATYTTGTLTIYDNAVPSNTQTVSLTGTGTSNQPTLVVSPSSLNFSSQTQGTTSAPLTVTLTNNSANQVNFSSMQVVGADFSQISNTCAGSLAANSSCSISVVFTPQTTGNLTGTLYIYDNAAGSPQTVSLSGTGTSNAPTLVISPSSLNFSSQVQGTTSAPLTVTLTNNSANTLNISNIQVIGADFSQIYNNCPLSLLANSSCSTSVLFHPHTTGNLTGTLYIYDNAAGSPQTVSLTGTGTSNAPMLVISPSSLNFGNQTQDTTSAPLTVTLTNNSANTLNISNIQVVGADFSQTYNNCPLSLLANSSCTTAVLFRPHTTGNLTGTLTISSNAAGSPQTIALTGTGISNQPTIVISPSSLNFGNQTQDTNSAPLTVTITNNSANTLHISNFSYDNLTDFIQTINTCSGLMGANSSCSISIVFRPHSTGNRTGTLYIYDDAAGSPQTVSLSGTGTSSQPTIVISPSSLNFGNQTQDTNSAPLTMTIANNSANTLHISNFVYDNLTDFIQTINTCSGLMGANSSCSISIVFRPHSTGNRTGTLTIYDDAAGSPQTVSLAGTGISNQPTLVISPSSLNFSNQLVTTASAPLTVTLTNNSANTLNISNIQVVGVDFIQGSVTCGGIVAANTSCSISVIFSPHSTGNLTGTLIISDNAAGSPQSVPLTGTGFINSQTINGFNLPSSVTYGVSPISLSASGGGSPNPVTFSVLSGPGLISGNTLYITGAGTVVVAANQAGNSIFTAATQVTRSLQVNKATAAIALTSSSNPVLVQNNVSLIATVTGVTVPSGSVTFFDGPTPLGTVPLSAGGVVTLITSSLAVGTHSITAAYSGDSNFNAVTSSTLGEVVDDITLSIPGTTPSSPPTITSSPGGTAVYTFSLSPVGSPTFLAPVTLSASGLPAGATYSFNPTTIPAGSGTTTVTLTINLPQIAELARPAVWPSKGAGVLAASVAPSSARGATHNPLRTMAPFALALLLPILGFRRKRLGRLLSVLLLLAGMSGAVGLTGCGSGFPTLNYDVKVTATSGTLVRTMVVNLTVQ